MGKTKTEMTYSEGDTSTQAKGNVTSPDEKRCPSRQFILRPSLSGLLAYFTKERVIISVGVPSVLFLWFSSFGIPDDIFNDRLSVGRSLPQR